MDVNALVGLCCKGKRNAQEELYRHFYAYALTVCLHYCEDRAEAEDVLIEGFTKAFKNIKQFDQTKDFKPWFRKLLVHSAIDYHRKYNKVKTSDNSLVVEVSDVGLSGLHQLQYNDLMAILQQLPTQYRLVFNLYEIEGFKHEEIAEKLGIETSTSKSNLSRAKFKLRKMLESYGVTAKRKEL
ncbi:MAG: sigma-70 family RNA polymerase sigma factor [Flavobacteriales bacterium]|nr:sigma-70 family RNA polymerase sigma factor [Flavobacteriales bacterium]